MYDEWVCYINNNYVCWMGMLYRIIMYDEWVCYIRCNEGQPKLMLMNGYVIYKYNIIMYDEWVCYIE